ncbi:hypothetical protein [Acidovorax sp. Root217]|uniref:hypothetical protein n=1 Tax=Acidovorax sp. Root217 TaxID=1736492 RepID=UPI00070AFE1A|nr:hypothetical protein [Acidovorax sp. Root217]KRC30690.1 hypothetical protein ASE31_00460 [Acidovorax sp. Root217]
MAQGKLFGLDLAAGAITTLYNPAGVTTTLTLSLCNRTAAAVSVRVALAATATPTAGEWIEYDVYLPPSGVMERSAIVIGSGQFLVARASAAGVSAVGFGFEEA